MGCVGLACKLDPTHLCTHSHSPTHTCRRCRCPSGKRGRAPVWVDPADEGVSVPVAAVARLRKLRQFKGQAALSGQAYEEALRRQHSILNPRTNWASSSGSSKRARGAAGAAAAAGGDYIIEDEQEPDESAAEQLLLSGSRLLLPGSAAAGSLLAPGSIEMSRLRDANGSSPCDAVVQALQFHPNGQLMLTAGFDKRLKLFQVGKRGWWGCGDVATLRGSTLAGQHGGVQTDMGVWVCCCCC